MNNYEKYIQAFKNTFLSALDGIDITQLEFQQIVEWDSVGHMALTAEIEDTFDIEMEMDDLIDFASFQKGLEILKKYGIEF